MSLDGRKGTTGSKGRHYFENLYFVDCCIIYNLIKQGKAKNISQAKKLFDIHTSTNDRCENIYDENNKFVNIDISKINQTSQQSKTMGMKDKIVEVDMKLVDYISELMETEKSNKEILNKLKIKLIKDGIIMENKNVKTIKMNVVCDPGNNLNKTCANKGEVITFINKISSEIDVNLITGDYLKNVDRQEHYVMADEFGEFNITQNKHEKKNIIENVYYCIARNIDALNLYEDNTNYSVNLGLLIPINQMKDKDKYKSIIEDQSVYEYECRINDKIMNLQVSIDNIDIMPEGAIAFTEILDTKGDIIIADVGSQTCNLSLISNGRFAKKYTLDHWGSFRYYRELIKKVNNSEVTIHNIQRYIENETPIDDENTIIEHDLNLLIDYSKDLLKEIKGAFGTRVNKIYYIGGTVSLLKDNGIEVDEKSIVSYVDNPSIVNVEGARKALNNMYKLEV